MESINITEVFKGRMIGTSLKIYRICVDLYISEGVKDLIFNGYSLVLDDVFDNLKMGNSPMEITFRKITENSDDAILSITNTNKGIIYFKTYNDKPLLKDITLFYTSEITEVEKNIAGLMIPEKRVGLIMLNSEKVN
jgi:hypothetical protein